MKTNPFWCALALAGVCAQTGYAATQFFTNALEFRAAAPTVVVVDFDSTPVGRVSGTEWFAMGVNFSQPDGGALELASSTQDFTANTPHNVLWAATASERIRISFPEPRLAVGFWLIDSEFQPPSNSDRVDFYDTAGQLLHSQRMPNYGVATSSTNANYFFGLISTTPIGAIIVEEHTDDGGESVGVDTVMLGQSALPKLQTQIQETNLVIHVAPIIDGQTYQLQRSESLRDGSWLDVGAPQVGYGGQIVFNIPLDSTNSIGFYRATVGVAKGWVLLNTNGPSAGGIAAYDSDRHVAVMFACVGSYPNDTWEYDGVHWRQITVSGPHGRDSSGKMVYDSFNKKMIMQGGWWPDDNDRWTWEYRVTGEGPDDRQWVNLVQVDCAYRGAPAMAYDDTRHTILSFGGNHWQSFYNDTWRFDASTNVWTHLVNWGPSRFAAGLVYDSARDKFVIFGGTGRWWAGDTEQGRGNTCEFDPKTDTWTEVLAQGATNAPGARWFPSMVYDPVARVTVLKGGGRNSDGYSYTDTWEWNGTTWTEIPNLPGQPTGGVMWFDTARQRIILFSAPNTYVYYR